LSFTNRLELEDKVAATTLADATVHVGTAALGCPAERSSAAV
jgi:hypothetical protein